MKGTKYIFIDDNNRGGVQVDGNEILIWIENKRKNWLFGSYFKRCSCPKLFHLVDGQDRYGCSINGLFLGRVMTLQDHERNIDNFDLYKEIKMLFSEYTQSIIEQNKIDKKLSQLINSTN